MPQQKEKKNTGEKVNFSNLEKIYWPEEKISKGDLIKYYEQIADYILPYLKNRPMSLRRNPDGIRDEGFYQKDAAEIAPTWMKTIPVESTSSNKTTHYALCNDLPSLLFLANLGCIEMNPWNSTISKMDYPDYIVMDIDPSEKNTFNDVIDVCLALKEILEEMKISGYCKTSGASGIHIYIPSNKKYNYDEVRDFSKLLATFTHQRLPGKTTLERSLSKRSNKHVYVDYLQNRRGQTLASCYSVRPKPGATVSTPLEWKEIKYGLNPSDFTINNIFKRLEKKGDLFTPILEKGFDMKKALRIIEKHV